MFIALFAALAMVLAACGDDADDSADSGDDSADSGDGDTGGGEISIAWIPWEENIAVAHMWEAILEEEGYDVTLNQYDVAAAFASVSGGEEDLFMDMWLPATHGSYQEQFGEDLEDYGSWFDSATLELTVPAYLEDINSIADVAENPELFDSEIQGIEAGAGMMAILADEVVPGYGLDEAGFEIVESSTGAMRAELAKAIEDEEPIVVTLWTPHPEYGLKDLKRLEDPEGLWGEAEQIHAVGRPGFSDDFPTVTEWIENWQMTDEELASINAAIDDADESDWKTVAADWVEANRDLVDGWIGG